MQRLSRLAALATIVLIGGMARGGRVRLLVHASRRRPSDGFRRDHQSTHGAHSQQQLRPQQPQLGCAELDRDFFGVRQRLPDLPSTRSGRARLDRELLRTQHGDLHRQRCQRPADIHLHPASKLSRLAKRVIEHRNNHNAGKQLPMNTEAAPGSAAGHTAANNSRAASATSATASSVSTSRPLARRDKRAPICAPATTPTESAIARRMP